MSLRLLLALAAVVAMAGASQAAAPAIAVSGAWARPTPPGATTGAVYLTISNRGPSADSLVSAASPAAAKVEFHAMSTAGGVMTMRQITGALPIASGGNVSFAAGAGHIMLVGLKTPLRLGAHISLTLTFAKAGAIKVSVPVRSDAGAAAPMAGMKM